MSAKFFDSTVIGSAEKALDFIGNVLESSTEYSVVVKDLDGKILLWNEGARRLYGYEPEEVVGRANAVILHTEEDVAAGKPKQTFDAALRDGKWEGTIQRRRRNGRVTLVSYNASIFRDSSGRLQGVFAAAESMIIPKGTT